MAPKKKLAKKSTKKPKKAATRKPKKAAAKKSGGMTAKVSPLKGMPVTAWVTAKAKGWHGEVVKALLALVTRVVPDATVSIKWGQPVFDLCGPIAWVKPAKAHVSFGFWRGAELTDHAGVLEGGSRMRHVKITSPTELDAEVITAFLIEAARLNVKLGDPTKRSPSLPPKGR